VLPDPRRARGRRFPLPYLLLFCVLAVLSGAKSFTHIVIFMRERREVLNQVFGSKFKSAPSINTVRLLLHAIGGEPLEATARGYAEHLVSDGAARDALPLIALDGKTLRPGFAVTGHTWTGAVPGKPQMSWLFAAAAAENTPKT